MAKLAVKPLMMKDVDLFFTGSTADDYAAHVNGVTFTPTAENITWTGLDPNQTVTETATPTWVATLSYVQDWDSAKSLSRYLFDNAGKTVGVTFRPRQGTGPSFTANLNLQSGPIGGQLNTAATSSVTMGCDKPKLVAAV